MNDESMQTTGSTVTASATSDNNNIVRGWKQTLWMSEPWITFQEGAKRFYEQSNNCDDMVLHVDTFGKSFDKLYRHIVAILEQQTAFSNAKTSSRVVLQVFTDFPMNPFIQLRSYSSFREHIEAGTVKLDDVLLQIQWQVRLRLALWERMGNRVFVSAWMHQILQDMPAKRRRRAKKERQGTEHAWKLCGEDLTSLISLGFIKLVQERPGTLQVEAFLNSCGLHHIRQQVPWKMRLVRDVWTFFDLVHDPKLTEKVAVKNQQQPSAVLPPLPIPEEESVKSVQTQSTTSTNKENGSSYFGKRVKLTAPAAKKTNSLLGNSGRNRFVGSHFNTNLTNMSALFRSVPSGGGRPVPLRKQNKPAARKRPQSPVQLAESPPAKTKTSSSSVMVVETPAPQRKRSRIICETPQELRRRRPLPLRL